MENKVLAIVEGQKITQKDVDIFINRLGPQQAPQFKNPEGQKRILEELINQELFLADAKLNQLEKSEEFKLELEKMKDVILTQLNISKLMNSVIIKDEEIIQYFENNKSKYITLEQADTSHILVETERECENIYQEIMNEKISFENAAKKYSKCPSKENGGDLGMFPKGKMVPEFEKVAFNMKEKEISKPVKTQFGYHLIRLNELKKGKEKKLKEVKNLIRNELITSKQHKLYSDKVNKLYQNFNVEIK
jgi:peptidyl-prolyl cis-trans isomerase C